jgi:hypothetical protein
MGAPNTRALRMTLHGNLKRRTSAVEKAISEFKNENEEFEFWW